MNRLYYLKHKEEIKQRVKEYREKNKEKVYQQQKLYAEEHKEQIKTYYKKYSEENKNKLNKYKTDYYNSKHGRAVRLSSHYMREDKKHNRGESTLTAKWIVENIFSKPCVYCGESDWHKIGCDRKDNSLPHTMDNVVPCCKECNIKKNDLSYDEYIKKIKESK